MPFKVSVLKAEIIQEKVPEEMTEENGDQVWRLSIQVKIENITEENFEDVSYEFLEMKRRNRMLQVEF